MWIGISAFAAEAPKPLFPIPSQAQLAWQELEYIAFAHFGVNTFTNREWGNGNEDPAIFNPTEFDAKQWVQVLNDAGMKMLILTAKHHDGFCLWPSQYTDHSVKKSPWRNGKGDMVREVADACREGGLKFGVYLSPWDRNQPSYGNSPVYNQFFRNQLMELLTNYGEITEVWFDGACGEGPNGKRQVYDWDSYYTVVRRLQPQALIFGCGPDIRWVGNESGVARETEWSVQVVTPEIRKRQWGEHQNGFVNGKGADFAHRTAINPKKHEFMWYPAECDVSIRPGWFYHPDQDDKVKSLEHLVDIYFKSVGRNGVLLLNLPPDKRGLIHENDAQRLRELRAFLDETFKTDLALDATATASNGRDNHPYFDPKQAVDSSRHTYWATDDSVTNAVLELHLGDVKQFNCCLLQEPIALGQRVYEYSLQYWVGGWQKFARGTTIGYKRLHRFPDVKAARVRLVISGTRACPAIQNFGLFQMPEF
ncbi:MAG: alpha-fucosidase [Candidatus Omnitrophota bacterium]|jgi:alpha-L-fucosidase|nr:MAG: alpha-fucosidase [Candidatus Omnitrophota bacterium]